MTLLNFSGAESGNIGEFDSKNANVNTANAISTSHPRSGTYCLNLNSTITAACWALLSCSSGSPRAVRFGFYVATLPTGGNEEICGWDSATQQEGDLQIGTDGILRLYARDGTTVRATGTAVLVTGRWYCIEIMVTNTANTSKTVQVRVNGATDIADTLTTETTANVIDFFFGVGTIKHASTYDYYYDDMAVGDDWIGDGKCAVVTGKTGAPTYDNWTKSSGTTAFNLWSEIPFNVTNQCISPSGTSNAQTELLAATSTIVGSNSIVNAVKVGMVAKLSAGTARTYAIRFRYSAADHDTTRVVTTSDAYWQTAVVTGLSLATLDAAEIGGVRSGTTSGAQFQIEDIWMFVDYIPHYADPAASKRKSFQHMLVR